MPTVLKVKSYRFHFYSNEGNEPSHIHCETNDGECKFWLEPIRLARNNGVKPNNLREIESIIFENEVFLKAKYDEFHSS